MFFHASTVYKGQSRRRTVFKIVNNVSIIIDFLFTMYQKETRPHNTRYRHVYMQYLNRKKIQQVWTFGLYISFLLLGMYYFLAYHISSIQTAYPTYRRQSCMMVRITTTYIISSFTCFSYVLMILLDCQNKMADYYINRPFCSDDFIRSYEIFMKDKNHFLELSCIEISMDSSHFLTNNNRLFSVFCSCYV